MPTSSASILRLPRRVKVCWQSSPATKCAANGSRLPVAGGDEALEKYSHLALSVDRVRHVGEVVAVVIAASAEIAEDALDDVEVEWEELPAAADLLSAYGSDSPPVFDGLDSNIIDTGEKKTDAVDEVFASAPHTLSQRMLSQRLGRRADGGARSRGCPGCRHQRHHALVQHADSAWRALCSGRRPAPA